MRPVLLCYYFINSMKSIWNYQKIIEEAKKYKTKNEWRKNSQQSYNLSRKLGFHKEATKHMLKREYKKFIPDPKIIKKILLDAKKYSSSSKWLKASSSYYHRARYYKIFDEATKHFINERNWTEESILNEAKKYKTVKEWRLNSVKSYFAAQRKKIFNKVVSKFNLIKIIPRPPVAKTKKWHFNEILKEAKKYKSRTDWQKFSASSYKASFKLSQNKRNLCIKHMNIRGSYYRRCVYKIEIKNTKKVYIGLTLNFEKRLNYHKISKKFKEIIKIYGKKSIIAEKLTEYIDAKISIKLEKKFIKKFKSKGYEVLNIAKAGSLGASIFIWNKEKVLKDALKYNKRSAWLKYGKGAPSYAKRFGFYEEATKHMKILNEKGKWTREKILKDALKYKTRVDWRLNSPNAYDASFYYGYYKQATKHMISPWKRN